jgi:hypothetical protein
MDNLFARSAALARQWNCMTKNMQAAIGRFKQLNEQAVKHGAGKPNEAAATPSGNGLEHTI